MSQEKIYISGKTKVTGAASEFGARPVELQSYIAEYLSENNITPSVPAYDKGYSIYTAQLDQAGTAAPVATVLGSNEIGSIVWTRTGVGVYRATLVGAFTIPHCIQFFAEEETFVIRKVTANYDGAPDYIEVKTFGQTVGTGALALADDLLTSHIVEIRVYD